MENMALKLNQPDEYDAAIRSELNLPGHAGSLRMLTKQQDNGVVCVLFAFDVQMPDGSTRVAQFTTTGKLLELAFRGARAAHPAGRWSDNS